MRMRGEKDKAEGVLQGAPAVRLLWLGEHCFNRKCVKLFFFIFFHSLFFGFKLGFASEILRLTLCMHLHVFVDL